MKKGISVFLMLVFLAVAIPSSAQFLIRAETEPEETVTLIVEMEGDPLLAGQQAAQYGAQTYADSTEGQNTLNAIETEQKQVQDQITKKVDSSASVQYTYTNVFNGFAIEVKKSDVEKIKALPGVAEVYESAARFLPSPVEEDDLQSGSMIGVSSVWSTLENYKGEGTAIAVIDSGFDITHEAFRLSDETSVKYTESDIAGILSEKAMNTGDSTPKLLHKSVKIPFAYNYPKKNTDVSYNASLMSHGTHVAGIAAGNNEKAMGTAPEAQLVMMQVFEIAGGKSTAYDVNIVAALDDAAKLGVDVINMSLGAAYTMEAEGKTVQYDKLIENAKNAGILCVCSAGNNSLGYEYGKTSVLNPEYMTGGNPSVIYESTAVGAVDPLVDASGQIPEDVRIAWYSSYNFTEDLGLKVELSAPGSNISSTLPDNQYGTKSGTSMSAPHIAGAAAVLEKYMKEAFPAYTGKDKAYLKENLLMSTADILADSSGTAYSPRVQGAGLANLPKAVQTKAIVYDSVSKKTKLELSENLPGQLTLSFTAENLGDTQLRFSSPSAQLITDDYYEENGTFYFSASKMKDCVSPSVKLSHTEQCEQTEIVLSPGEKKTVRLTVTMNLDELNQKSAVFQNGFFIDGFITLKSLTEEQPDLHLPLTGFYGDWDQASIFDSGYYTNSSFFGQTYLYGLLEDSSKQILGVNPFDETLKNPDAIAYSPNGDNRLDALYVSFFNLRSAGQYAFVLRDESGAELDKLEVTDVQKFKAYTIPCASLLPALNGLTDGIYTFEMTASTPHDNTAVQCISFPLRIDTQAPVIHSAGIREENGKTYLSVTASDSGSISGFTLEGQKSDGTAVTEKTAVKTVSDNGNCTAEFDISDFLAESLSVRVKDYAENESLYAVNAEPLTLSKVGGYATSSQYVVTMKVTNNSEETQTFYPIPALYAAENRLLYTRIGQSVDAVVLEPGNSKELDYMLPKADGTKRFALFCWRDWDTLEPLCTPYETTVE